MRSKRFLRVMPMFAVAALVVLTATSAWSAGYKVLYNFGTPSSTPSSGLITDAAGNAYGTTSAGGYNDGGTVYELSPKTGYHLLYAIRRSNSGGADGFLPQGNLVFDSNGNLYGTTVAGGTKNAQCVEGCGVVFELTPPVNGGLWSETVLYSFCSQANCADGANPQAGVIIDSTGNLYGTTEFGGNLTIGTVFLLTPSAGTCTETVLCDFSAGGANPEGGLIFDKAGNLYGTTAGGGESSIGTVFELSPTGGNWVESVLYAFNGFTGSTDGSEPTSGLVSDAVGNLYGTTAYGGEYGSGGNTGYGTVFELSPGPGGSWTEMILYNFAGGNDGIEPRASLAIDSSGNLYGTTLYGGGITKACNGHGCGTVFKLTSHGGQWVESLFRFTQNVDDGYWPSAPVLLDSLGDVYGTTTSGGTQDDNFGVVFRIKQ